MENEGNFVVKELAWSSRDVERAFVQSTWFCIRSSMCSPGAALQGMGSTQNVFIGHGELWAELGGSTRSLPASQEVQEQPWSSLGAPSCSWCEQSWCSPKFRQSHQHPPDLADLLSRAPAAGAGLTSTTCSTHTPWVEHGGPLGSAPFPATPPNHSNVPLPLQSFSQGSTAGSSHLPDNACGNGGSHRPPSDKVNVNILLWGSAQPSRSLSCRVCVWRDFCKHCCALLLLFFSKPIAFTWELQYVVNFLQKKREVCNDIGIIGPTVHQMISLGFSFSIRKGESHAGFYKSSWHWRVADCGCFFACWPELTFPTNITSGWRSLFVSRPSVCLKGIIIIHWLELR